MDGRGGVREASGGGAAPAGHRNMSGRGRDNAPGLLALDTPECHRSRRVGDKTEPPPTATNCSLLPTGRLDLYTETPEDELPWQDFQSFNTRLYRSRRCDGSVCLFSIPSYNLRNPTDFLPLPLSCCACEQV